jgi:hypothetical protein
MHADAEIAEACCLAISYYTGFFKESLDRDSNLLIKLESLNVLECVKKKRELQDKLCIGFWLLKALSYLPLHSGEVTRCISLKE